MAYRAAETYSIMNKRNYQREMDELLAKNEEAGIRPSLLMHSCCAPCSSYVMEYLAKRFRLTMYFYNPNMDSRTEFEKRASELERLINSMNEKGSDIELVVAEYEPQEFERIAKGHETDPERGERCHLCYRLRLEKTAGYMSRYNDEHPGSGFDYFATTLTLSPLKDAEVLNDIARQIAVQYDEKCLETDFKKRGGYQRSIELSKEYGLYRQNYCGCRFSKAAAVQTGGNNNE